MPTTITAVWFSLTAENLVVCRLCVAEPAAVPWSIAVGKASGELDLLNAVELSCEHAKLYFLLVAGGVQHTPPLNQRAA